MSNEKKLFIILLSVVLITSLSIVSAGDGFDNKADSTDAGNDTVEKDNMDTYISMDESKSQSRISADKMEKSDLMDNIQKDEKNIKASKTIIINNRTYSTYFSDQYLNDRVSAGDVLDFQGKFIGNYSMYINKPVNITSTTKDAYIYLNTTAEDWFGGDDVAAFTITKSGAYTNVSDIHFYNSQIYVKNSHHIIFNNITAIVEDSTVGRGVGQTSIRDNSSFVTVENSTFSTKNQWGGCTLVLAWANNCTIRYNTITGIEEVGNLFYLTTFNVDALPYADGRIDYSIVNVNNTFENNLLIGPGYAQGMCYVICLSGTNNRIVNNTVLNYNGYGINVQAYSFDYDMKTLIANNTLNGSNFFMPNGSTVINNTVTGNFTIGTRSIVENNTISNVRLIYDNITLSNTRVDNVVISSQKKNIAIENCNISHNITIRGSNVAEVPINITIRNNTIGENIIINGSKNSTVINNTIAKQILVGGKNSINNNLSIYNNSIVNDEEYTIIVDKKVRGLNISDNYLIARNTTGNDSVYINDIYDDYIISNGITRLLLNESNYNRFFNTDGTIKSEFANKDINLEITSKMNNHKFIFANGIYNLTNPKGYLLTNSSIEVKATANLTMSNINVDSFIFELTDSNYNHFFNSGGTVKSAFVGPNVTFVVKSNMNNRKFIFTGGHFNFTNSGGYTFTNSTVEIKASALVSLNNIRVRMLTYELTSSNYERFFDADGVARSDMVHDNVTLLLAGNIKNKNFTFHSSNVIFTNSNAYNLTKAVIEVKSNANLTLNNITADRIIFELTDANYNRFFNNDGRIKSTFVGLNVTFVVKSNMNNRKFIFTGGRFNFTNPDAYTFNNSTVEIKASALVSLNNIRVRMLTYELTSSNYDRFFDARAAPRSDMIYDNVTLLLAGNIKNKNYTFTGSNVIFTNSGGYNLTNAVIEVKANANLTLSNITADRIIFELTDSNYNRFFNSDGTVKSAFVGPNVTFVVKSNMNNRKFIFSGGQFNFTNIGNYNITRSSVEVRADADVILENIRVDVTIYELTDYNYHKFFDDNQKARSDVVKDNVTLLLASNITNKNFIFNDSGVILQNTKNYTLTNTTIELSSKAHIYIDGLIINNTNKKAIIVDSTDNIINNTRISISTSSNASAVTITASNNTLDNLNIKVKSNNTQNNASIMAISIESNDSNRPVEHTSISNTMIDMEGVYNAYGLYMDDVSYLSTSNMSMNINSTGTSYPLYILDSSNTVISASIVSNATNTSYAAYITQRVSNRTSNITLTGCDADLTSANITAIYTDVSDISIQNSRYMLNASNITAITIGSKNIDSPAKNININNVTIDVKSSDEARIVLMDNASDVNITNSQFVSNNGEGVIITNSNNVLVDNNYINLTSDYTVEVADSNNVNVTNNGLYALIEEGDASVSVDNSLASIHDNNLLNSIVKISGNLTVYKPSDIIVTVTDMNSNPINYGSVVINVDDEDYDVIFSNGRAILTYTANSMDNVNVTAVYTSPNKLQISNKASLNVAMIATKTTLTPASAIINQKITVNATIKDQLDRPVNEGILTFTDDNGNMIGSFNITGGKSSISLNYPKSGAYNITAVYSNSTKYKSSTAKATVTVNKVNIDITGSLTVFTSDNITVKLTNQNNDSVTAGKVDVYVNNVKQNVSIINGVATVGYTPQNMDNLIVTAVYTTPDNFSVNKTATLKVKMIDTKMTLTSAAALVNQKLTINTTIKDVLNNPVRDGLVTFKDDKKNLLSTAKVSKGLASLNINYTKVGLYNITAVYSNSSTYKDSNATATVTVNQVNIDIKGNITVFVPSNITVNLSYQNKSMLTSGSLTVLVNNKNQQVTFKNGVSSFNYTAQSTDKLNISVVYTAVDKFTLERNSTLSVSKIASTIEASSQSVLINQTASIKVTVKDALGKKVKDGTVSLKEANKTLTSSKVSDGLATLNISYQKVGLYNLTLAYSSSSTYKDSNAKIGLTVNQVNIDISSNLTVFTPSNITVKLSYQNKSLITSGSLSVKINAKNQAVTFKNGVASFNYTPQTTDKLNISVVYLTPDKFSVGRNATLAVSKIATKLTVSSDKKTTRVNDKIKLTFTLSDVLNSRIASQKINVSINNNNYTITSNKTGMAIIEYVMKKNDKNLTLTASYAGNTLYKQSLCNLTLNRSYKADMQLLTGSFNTKPGDSVKLIAHIRDNGVDIDGGQLVFKLNGVSLRDDKNNSMVVAIKNGLAVLEYKIPDTLRADTHNLTAVYASNTYKRVELTTTMTINKFTTHIDVNPIYTAANIIQVKAQVVDQNNQALNKETKMCIKINGKSYTFNTINGTIDYRINQTLKNGYYNLTIISGENGKYNSSTVKTVLVKSKSTINVNYINNTLNTNTLKNSGSITTNSILTVLTGASSLKPGDRFKLIAHLSDDGIDITGGQLVFKINGKSLTNQKNESLVVNIKDGLGILDYKIPDTLAARTHELIAVYSSKKVDRLELKTSLTTNKLNTHIITEPVFTSSNSTYIKAEIRDDNNQLVNRQMTVVIKINGKSFTINTTNAKINYKVPFNLTAGLHQVSIISGENGKYLSSRINTVIVKS